MRLSCSTRLGGQQPMQHRRPQAIAHCFGGQGPPVPCGSVFLHVASMMHLGLKVSCACYCSDRLFQKQTGIAKTSHIHGIMRRRHGWPVQSIVTCDGFRYGRIEWRANTDEALRCHVTLREWVQNFGRFQLESSRLGRDHLQPITTDMIPSNLLCLGSPV